MKNRIIAVPKLSPWQQHVGEWSSCTRCPLCKTRKQVVLARGQIPADVLLVGEGPGDSEDVLGRPFIGPAGKLLDNLVEEAVASLGSPVITMAWTNIVACIPKAPDPKRKSAEPLPKEIEACSPRLEQFLSLVKPRLIIAVGELAAKEGAKRGWRNLAHVVEIKHPAWLMRLDVSQYGLQVQRCVIQLTDAFAQLLEEPSRA